ncbi:unnamed protein product [Candida verbasci]|uniref:LSM complex subunit LSM4 n=1 Tax=Candida verbasci TaxID=1227364 RepID=A0A9W4XC73_9ASCO|nr:unnamed protein product [Candida verbasci]
MLPLYLLTSAKEKPILVELKTGETFNGNLINCDPWMNLTLSNVIQTNANGDKFEKIEDIYIRGIHVKYLRIPDEIMSYAKEQSLINMEQRNTNAKNRRTEGGNRNSQSHGGHHGYRNQGRRGGRRNPQN